MSLGEIPVGAYCAEPLTTSEIDAHPDAARIWATIQQMRDEHESDLQEFPEVDGILDITFTVNVSDGDIWLSADYPDPIDQRFHDAIEESVNDTMSTLRFVSAGVQVE